MTRSRAPVGAGLSATVVTSIRPDLGGAICGEPDGELLERLRLAFSQVGAEAPGRYTYMSPDGEGGAELGRGGIGRVLIAMDEQLGREVAIKELLTGSDSGQVDPELMARFLAEARITGQLEHPNIVPVYELGRRTDGRLYYTMRVVRGETMSAALERAQTLSARLSLLSHFAGLCHAIAYAHSRGVVHRDIKPDNVMIGEFGETIVLDWGIAKVKGQPEVTRGRAPRGIGRVGETSHGDLVGTPLFMSPEQARGDVDQIDEASDVWSLGVVLYMLLTGRPPFTGRTAEEVMRRVTSGRFSPVQSIEPLAPSELCAVVSSALCAQKAERYASVRDLAQDVEAFMSGARVSAYDYSALELLRRFYQRHRPAALVAMVALTALLGVATELQRRILSARDRALSAEATALEKERLARQSLGEVFTQRAHGASLEGDVVAAELYAARALISGERADARGTVVAQTSRHDVSPLHDDAAFQACAESAGSGNGEVACARGRELMLYRPSGGTLRWQLPEPPVALTLSGDARTLLGALEDGRLLVYDATTGVLRAQFRSEPGSRSALALSSDGQRFASTSESGWAQLWDTASAALIARVRLDEPITSQAFTPSGELMALGGRLGALALWDPLRGTLTRLEGHRGTITAIAFAPRGEWLASAASDRSLSLWSVGGGKRLAPPLGELGIVQSLGWSRDATTLVFGSEDGMLGLVEARRPRSAERVRGHPGAVLHASFAGPQIVTLGAELGLRLWSHRPPRLPRELGHKSNVLSQAFAASDALATAGLAQDGVCLWQISESRCTTRLPVKGQVRALAVHASSGRLAFGTSRGVLDIWSSSPPLPEQVLQVSDAPVRSLEFTPDGAALLSSSSDGTIVLWDVSSGAALRRFDVGEPVHDALLDAERGACIVGTHAGKIELIAADGARLASVHAHDEWVMDLARHRPTGVLASAGGNGEIAFWSAAADERPGFLHLGSASAHRGRTLSVDFSPDGTLLASGGEDGAVVIWSVERREPLARLEHHRGAVRSVRFSPEGSLVSSAGDDGSVRLWDLSRLTASGERLLSDVEARSRVRLEGVKLVLLEPPSR